MLIVIGKCSIICIRFYSLTVLFAAFSNKKLNEILKKKSENIFSCQASQNLKRRVHTQRLQPTLFSNPRKLRGIIFQWCRLILSNDTLFDFVKHTIIIIIISSYSGLWICVIIWQCLSWLNSEFVQHTDFRSLLQPALPARWISIRML